MGARRKTLDGRRDGSGTPLVEAGMGCVIMRKRRVRQKIFFSVRRSMANRPVSRQTNNKVDLSRSVDTQAPLVRVYTFGAFHLDWQVPPCTTEDLWKSRTSARTLLKLLLCAPGRQASRSQLAGIL